MSSIAREAASPASILASGVSSANAGAAGLNANTLESASAIASCFISHLNLLLTFAAKMLRGRVGFLGADSFTCWQTMRSAHFIRLKHCTESGDMGVAMKSWLTVSIAAATAGAGAFAILRWLRFRRDRLRSAGSRSKDYDRLVDET